MVPVSRRFSRVVRNSAWLRLMAVIFSAAGIGVDSAQAIPPRSERVINRAAERAYARASIAEARAARAEARVAEIAPIMPVPPPPRPATVRRMRRAGVPLGSPPPFVSGPAPVIVRSTTSAVSAPPVSPAPPPAIVTAAPPAASLEKALPAQPAARQPSPASDHAADGTRSVLATAVEPATEAESRGPSPIVDTGPPIELLPTPQPE